MQQVPAQPIAALSVAGIYADPVGYVLLQPHPDGGQTGREAAWAGASLHPDIRLGVLACRVHLHRPDQMGQGHPQAREEGSYRPSEHLRRRVRGRDAKPRRPPPSLQERRVCARIEGGGSYRSGLVARRMPKDRLRVTPGTVEVVFGKLIPTSVYSLDTKGDLIAAVRGRIVLVSKCPAAQGRELIRTHSVRRRSRWRADRPGAQFSAGLSPRHQLAPRFPRAP